MNMGLLQLLRVLHILSGAFWYGASVLMAIFLGPSLEAAGPAGAQVMRQMVAVRRLHVWLSAAAIVTVLAGIWLYGWRSAGFDPVWMGSAVGMVYTASGLFALAAATVGLLVVGRSASQLGSMAPPPAVAAQAPAPAIAGGAIGASAPGPAPEPAIGAAPAGPPAEVLRLRQRLKVGSRATVVLLTLAILGMAVARYA